MAGTLTVIWWRDIPAQVIAKDERRASKIVLHPRFQVAIDRAALKAGRREMDAYIAKWRKEQRRCGDDLEAAAREEAERLEAHYTKERLNELVSSRWCRRDEGGLVTHTVIASATREVVIGDDRPFVIIGERINPTGRPLLAEEMKSGDFEKGRAGRAGPGRGRRTHVGRQRRHSARGRARDARDDGAARAVAH